MKSNIDLGRENNSGGESWGRLGGGGRYSYLMMEGPRETHGEGE